MTFVAFGLVILGVFLVLFSMFNYLQKDIGEKKDPNNWPGFNNDKGFHGDPGYLGGMKNSNIENQDLGPETAFTQGTVDHKAGIKFHEKEEILSVGKDVQGPNDITMSSKNSANIPEKNQAENNVNMNLYGNINSPDKVEENRKPDHSHFLENIETLKRGRDLSEGKTADAIIFRGRTLYYEDKTGIIKYDGSDIDVDETLSSYQKFFRVGEGLLSLTESGLTFQNDAMLFHLTFEEVKNFIFYQNCIVVLTRKEDIARIFFPDKYTLFRSGFKEMMEREYTEIGDKGKLSQIV